ncbi:MAG: hypothetical protein ACXAEN_26675, partial [Candidatus Thorarchaeota archaeon]
NAHKNNEMSYWDRFVDRFNFSFTTKRFWNYFKDKRYYHSRDGMGYFRAGSLLADYDQLGDQIEESENERTELKKAIKELAPDMLIEETVTNDLIDMDRLEDN